jgi:hypothetical protein
LVSFLLYWIVKKKFFLSLSIFTLGLFFIEYYFYNVQSNTKSISGQSYIDLDEKLGWCSKKSFSTSLTETINNQITYKNINFHFDSKGRRISKNQKRNSTKKHAIFLGGSFTFGDGIDFSDTFPAHLSNISKKKYEIYNYALSGYGPTQNLLLLKDQELYSDIINQNGICIYTMKAHHINRATGVPRYLRENHRIPVARIDGNDELNFFRFYDLPKMQIYHYKLYDLFRNSSYALNNILQKKDFLMISWKEAIDINVRIFNEMCYQYKSYLNGSFFLFVRESESMPDKWRSYLISKLKEFDINYFLEPKTIPLENIGIHPLNMHPNSAYNKWSAQLLVDQFNL